MEFEDGDQWDAHAGSNCPRCGRQYGHQQRFRNGKQSDRSSGHFRGERRNTDFVRSNDYVDDGPGVELASGIWNHQQLWLSEHSELDADDLAFRDVDRVGGIDHLFLPGAITIGAGRIGDIGRLYLHKTAAAPVGPQPLLQMHLDQTEVSGGVTNGSAVTPSIAPAGFTGAVVANGTGSVNFAAAETGNGVYFLNCCVTPTTPITSSQARR